MDGIKFDKNKNIFKPCKLISETFVLNKAANQDQYDTSKGLDFVFSVDGKDIKASTYLLAMNSDVFQTMLINDWKDSREGRVDIEDVEFDVMNTFVRALHGVEMTIKDITMAIKLMIVADKYKVEPLQVLAENYVKNGIRGDSVIDALVVSHQLGITDIQEKCLTYIGNCKKPLIELTGYDKVPQEVAVLVIETVYKKLVQPK